MNQRQRNTGHPLTADLELKTQTKVCGEMPGTENSGYAYAKITYMPSFFLRSVVFFSWQNVYVG